MAKSKSKDRTLAIDTALRAVMRYSNNNEQTNFSNVSD